MVSSTRRITWFYRLFNTYRYVGCWMHSFRDDFWFVPVYSVYRTEHTIFIKLICVSGCKPSSAKFYFRKNTFNQKKNYFAGHALFPGSAVEEQLLLIFHMLGTPSSATHPTMCNSTTFRLCRFPQYRPSSLQNACPRIDQHAADLLHRLLQVYHPFLFNHFGGLKVHGGISGMSLFSLDI